MADNVTLQDADLATVPTGTVVATDNIGGVNYQRVKETWGADGVANDVSAATPLPVDLSHSGAIPLPTGAATDATLQTLLTTSDFDTKTGSLTETAPATDTASSGLNGRLQRIAQRITSLLAVFPATIDTNSGNKSSSTLRVVLATDQPALTNKLLVTPDANSAVNIAQMNGVATTMGNGTSGTGVQRVTIASDSTGQVALAAGTNTIGKTFAAPQTTKALTQASVSISSSGDNTVVSGTSSQTIRVFRLTLVAASAVSVTIKNGTAGTALTGAIPLVANGSLVVDCADGGEPAFVSASGGNFVVNLSSAVTVTGWVDYTKS